MIKLLTKHLSQETKARILRFPLYRLYERMQASKAEVAFRCEFTSRCNLSCNMCTRTDLIHAKKFNSANMEKPVLDRVIEEVKKFHEGGKRVSFTTMGLGEPLMFPGLFEAFQRIKDISPDIRIIVVTNGILLDDEVCRQMIAHKVNEVTVSLNVNSPGDYQRHMGKDAYAQVVSNVRRLISLRNESGDRFPDVIVQYLDYENDMSRYDGDIKQWVSSMRFGDKCYIHPIVNEGGNHEGSTFGVETSPHPCTMPMRYVAVNVRGDIYPCDPCYFAGGQRVESLYLGNIMTDSPWEMAQKKDNLRCEIVNRMRLSDYASLPQCAKCNNYKLATNIYFRLPGRLRINGFRWI